ncbi:MAG: hypothetical protein ABW039_10960 [Sphingobium sp.]
MIRLAAALLLATPFVGTVAHAQAAPAAATPTRYTTEETDVGTLLDDPAAKAVLVKHLPEIAKSEQIDMARSLTLRQMQSFASDKVTDETLAKIDADLVNLPVKK